MSFSLLLLYATVGYFSIGFDDEFSNMRWISTYGFGVVQFVQAFDVHPPGSYIFDYLLYNMLGKWALVRLCISLLTVLSLIYAILSMKKRKGTFAAIVLFILLGLNPSILLWCTSLRWYAMFVPILIWLSVVPQQFGWNYWIKCFAGLLLLGYLSYAIFIVALPLLLLYWKESKELTKEKAQKVIVCGIAFLVCYAYQFSVFFAVHQHRSGGQVSSLLKSLMGFYTAHFSNQGVFPLSFPGLLAAAATIGIFTTVFYSNWRQNLKNNYLHSYAAASVIAVASGLAGKARNLVVLSPWQVLFLASAKVEAAQKKLFLFFLGGLLISNLWGDFNIITHQNTSKGDYNLPIAELLTELHAEKIKCNNDLIILCHSPSLSWHLQNAGYQVMDPYNAEPLPKHLLASKHRCVVLLKTWPGSMNNNYYQRLYNELKQLKFTRSNASKFGQDAYYVIKNKLDARYPEYSVELTKYYQVENLAALKSWNPWQNKWGNSIQRKKPATHKP